MVFFKIRQQKGLRIAWSEIFEFFCYIDVQEFHLWFAWRFLSLSLRRKASCTWLPAFFIRFASSEHCVQSMYPKKRKMFADNASPPRNTASNQCILNKKIVFLTMFRLFGTLRPMNVS
jgi:hypothetical protein